MADIVNLRAAKKQAARHQARVRATANAAKFGRTKAERTLQQAKADQAARTLDGHKREEN